ncbi:MAG: hypothetical protein QM674_12275 [Burkholderiaceae bacterium]
MQAWSIVPPQPLQMDSSMAILQIVTTGVGWAITTPVRCDESDKLRY